MLTKIRLFHEIREFYKIFFADEKPFITKLSDITNDNLCDVLFDIHEVLYANQFLGEKGDEVDIWLNKLDKKIRKFCNKKRA